MSTKVRNPTVDMKILDGGFSTQLSTHVGEKIDGDPLWTARFLATNPDAVYATHLDFLQAGADIIETNTYQASVPGLMKHLSVTEEESIQLIRKAVYLARKAVTDYMSKTKKDKKETPLIAGSCGPYGASLHDASEYNGTYGKTTSSESIMTWHKPRIQALVDEGVDLLALETIPCIQEARALIKLLKEYPAVKVWFSFSCNGPDQTIVDGSSFQEVALECYNTALPGQVVAIGVNCIAPKYVTPLLRGINQRGTIDFIPLIAYPNNGEVYTPKTGWIKNDSDRDNFLQYISEWYELGVRYLGGCCRMYAENIKSIRDTVTALRKS